MDIRHHGADVASSVGLAAVLPPFKRSFRRLNRSAHKVGLLRQRRYLRELLLLQILRNGGLKVSGVPFVQAVNLAALLDPHVPIDQDKLADRLRGERDGNVTLVGTGERPAGPPWGRRRVLTGSSMKQLTPWPVEITIMVALP